MRRLAIVSLLSLAVAAPSTAAVPFQVRTLDGSNNNARHPDWGQSGTLYLRVGEATYADNVSAMVPGPPPRYTSNRIFNDVGQNLFSENGISQWGWTWGQFIDHDIGLRDQRRGESAPIAFDSDDPLEGFTNDFGEIGFARTPAAPDTGVNGQRRQQINALSSYIDGSGVYGVTNDRLEWLREGPVDGNPANNGARLLLPTGYLPRADARGEPAKAPAMDLFGAQVANPANAVVAGDVRANENMALTAVHTLFAREHNRIVAALPNSISEEDKFQIARRVVGAEMQFITYNEFLPTLGVALARYKGYKTSVNAGLSNEFAVVGYRAHSMVHGDFDAVAPAGTYSQEQLEAFEEQGIEVEEEGDEVELEIPLNLAFGAPGLLEAVTLAPFFFGLGLEAQYKNDEQIDNALRSVLFQVPAPGARDPSVCAEPTDSPDCFDGVVDLGAIDAQRGRDHGLPSYLDLRRAYGLALPISFTAMTGESTSDFPSDPKIDRRDPINDPSILDFVELRDADGNVIPLGSPESEEEAVEGIRRSTLAARLKAIYGTVDKVEAIVGMLSEPHVSGTEFGPLQLAIWKKQFAALRDGDRYFYLNDPDLNTIRQLYGIDHRHTLGEIIEINTGVAVQDNVFEVASVSNVNSTRSITTTVSACARSRPCV